jgi:hypothetical protein
MEPQVFDLLIYAVQHRNRVVSNGRKLGPKQHTLEKT